MSKTKIIAFLYILFLLNGNVNSQEMDLQWVDSIFNRSMEQYVLMKNSVPDYSTYPRTVFDEDTEEVKGGETMWVNSKDWVAGFYPGVLWNFYKYSNDTSWANLALKMCDTMLTVEITSDDPVTNCDIGFVYYTALLPAYEYTGDNKYKNKLIEAADALKGRFIEVVGSSDSWDFGSYKRKFFVIIDHLMNLDLLLWATEITQDTSYRHAALTHATTAIKDQHRTDFSSHRVEYNASTGAIISDTTHQSKPGQEAFSRRSSWSVYAYTYFAGYTGEERFLTQAEGVANFWVNHKNMREDYIPYKDLNNPSTSQYRDASAACITVAALLKLYKLSEEYGAEYFEFAMYTLKSLASPEYFAAVGENNYFLIMHGDGGTNSHDAALIYSDYYFTQALLWYKESLISNEEIVTSIVQTNNKELLMHFSPNPVMDHMNIVVSGDLKNRFPVTVTNVEGKIVFNDSITSGNHTLDLSNLSKGIYIFRLTNNKQNISKKFIKL